MRATPCRCFPALLLALGAGLGSSACSRPPSALSVDAGVDAAPLNDGGVDAGPDAAPPLRRMTTWRLFGTLPLENRFFDPTFSLVDGVAWMPFDLSYSRLTAVTPMVRPSPTGTPVLGVASGGTQPVTVMGGARSVYGPAEVSLWIATGAGANPPDVSLLGLYPGGEGSVDLSPDPATAPVEMDGLSWRLWRAEIVAGPIGWATLRVVNRDAGPIFLNGPLLVPRDKRKAARGRWAAVRPLRAEERTALRAFWGRIKDWF